MKHGPVPHIGKRFTDNRIDRFLVRRALAPPGALGHHRARGGFPRHFDMPENLPGRRLQAGQVLVFEAPLGRVGGMDQQLGHRSFGADEGLHMPEGGVEKMVGRRGDQNERKGFARLRHQDGRGRIQRDLSADPRNNYRSDELQENKVALSEFFGANVEEVAYMRSTTEGMNNFANGNSPLSTVRVLVGEGTAQEQFVEFGPQSMPTSDGNGSTSAAWWHVTTVSWPSGVMNPPGVPVGGGDSVGGGEATEGSTDGWTVECWLYPTNAAQTGAVASYGLRDGRHAFVAGLSNNIPVLTS